MFFRLVALTLLAGCSIRASFQPLPYSYEVWEAPNKTLLEIKMVILECGGASPENVNNSYTFQSRELGFYLNENQKVIVEKCIRNAGYTKKIIRGSYGVEKVICGKIPAPPACLVSVEDISPSKETRINSPYCKKFTKAQECQS
ncbi:hypothetical protein [Chromobacterium sp. Rain0013]|uniref:hypothetical protein n=1 Tax=Chromobacterium sp. Rain0013 TaxID=2292447 RepID=UPI001888888C|nr:hypothetical protein [Chromobacterium sp. Rain0013]